MDDTLSIEPQERIFRNPSGQYYLKQIFYETATDSDRPFVLYTLKPQDHKGQFTDVNGVRQERVYPSLRRLYLELGDESEYQIATKYFGGWPHWKRLLQCNWFLDYLSEIREELQLRNSAEALLAIREVARTKADKGSLQANKYLLEGTWRPKDAVGRPTKKKIKEEADRLFKSREEVEDDLDRIKNELERVSYS